MDSTEMSFVKCPQCKSLVPATSARCRMCGFGLEGVVTSLTDKAEKTNGRVRQQTFTESDDKVSAAIEKIREEEVTPAVTVLDEEDPLKAYLDDTESSDEQEQSQEASAISEDEIDDEDEDTVLESILDDIDEEDELESILEEVEEPKAAVEHHAVTHEASPASVTSEPRVIVEQGSRKSGGLSFGGNKQETPPPVRNIQQREPHGGRKMEEPRSQRFDNEPKRPMQKTPSQQSAKHSDRAAPVSDEMVGRLYGWLVSFASPEGAAVELREGRFFITSQSMRDSDLVLTDSSVSSPHALMIVSSTSGLMVQDLVSAQGVFVKAVGERAYRREIDPVKLYHGDYLRVGNVEFLVSLLPDAR